VEHRAEAGERPRQAREHAFRDGGLEEGADHQRLRPWELGGDRLKTAPRGYDLSHPRIALLRHKSLTIGHDYGFEPIIHTPELLEAVRDDWRTLRPFVEWVTDAE